MDLEQALAAANDLMYEVVRSDVELLEEASHYIIAAGGKRVRPRVLFLAYQVAGGKDLAATVPIAAAIELVHTATLVHDDINDHGRTRRGRVTINEQWGRTFALLTGDFLFTKVYSLMAPYGDLNVTFAEATIALVEGETLQAEAARNNSLNRQTYQRIVAKKTASLFRASAMLGAQLAGADQRMVDNLGEYGFFLGLAFQVVDDLLDLTGDPGLMGKEIHIDMVQGKGMASAVAHGENGRGDGRAPTTSNTTAVAEMEGDPFLPIKRRLIEEGAIEEGRAMAHMLAQQAAAKLALLPPGPAVDELHSLIAAVVERDH
jgi:geranylgeranyl pyrophosphate synthase